MMRLFAGVTLPGSLRDHLSFMAAGLPDARWVARENLHLTLRFIGEVDEPVVDDIDLSLSTLTFDPFSLTLAGMDCFHSRNKVRAVWAGVEPSEALSALQEKVEGLMIRAGLPPEGRKFTPHVTLARLKQVPLTAVLPYLESHAGFRSPPFGVSQVTLFRSHLGHGGAVYEALATYPSKT